jgi:hypothetical protein
VAAARLVALDAARAAELHRDDRRPHQLDGVHDRLGIRVQ